MRGFTFTVEFCDNHVEQYTTYAPDYNKAVEILKSCVIDNLPANSISFFYLVDIVKILM